MRVSKIWRIECIEDLPSNGQVQMVINGSRFDDSDVGVALARTSPPVGDTYRGPDVEHSKRP